MDIKSINRFVKNGFLSTHTLGLMGNHGIGKTSYVHNTIRKLVAEKHQIPLERVHVISRCVSIMDPADLIGNFQEFGGRTYSCPPSWIPTCKEYDDQMAALYEANGQTYTRLTKYDDIYVLFLDECKRGNSIIQDAIMELLLEHRLFGVNLKENTYVVCADNDNAKIYNGTRRDPAQESRIKNVTFAPTDKEYLEDFKSRVERGEIHEVIPEFLNKYPEFIVLPTKTIEELSIQGKKGPCPRDWTQLGECLQEYRRNGDDITAGDTNYLMEIATSYIGASYAMKFANYCETDRKSNIDPKRILNNLDEAYCQYLKATFAATPNIAVPTATSVLERVKKTKLNAKQGKNILAFLECCPNEAIAAFVKEWQKEAKDQYLAWRVTPPRYRIFNKAILNTEIKNGNRSAYDSWVATFLKLKNLKEADLDNDDLIIEG